MLKRIHIKNFRSCKDVILDRLGSMTALVGRNGSGKTNILRAIDRLARMALSSDLLADLGEQPTPANPSVTIDLQHDDEIYRYKLSVDLKSSREDTEMVITAFLQESLAMQRQGKGWETIIDRKDKEARIQGRHDPIRLTPLAPCLPALTALLPENEQVHQHIRPLLAFLRATHYYPFVETSDAEDFDALKYIADYQYEQWLSDYRSTGQADDSVVMRILYAYHERKSQFKEIQALLGPKGLDLIDLEMHTLSFTSKNDGKENAGQEMNFYSLLCYPGKSLGGGNEPRSFAQLSLGTRRVMHIVVSLVLDGSSLSLIEHPEDGIHRGLVRKLIDMLRANADPGQIILSSHSGVVLNSLNPQDVRLVTIQRGSTKVRSLTPKEVAAAAKFIDDDGTLADFLQSVEE